MLRNGLLLVMRNKVESHTWPFSAILVQYKERMECLLVCSFDTPTFSLAVSPIKKVKKRKEKEKEMIKRHPIL